MEPTLAHLAASPQALALLDTLPPYPQVDALAWSSRWRSQGVDPQLAAVVLTQARLRHAATAKLGPAATGMLFTQDGLEQATRATVAAHHAARFTRAGVRHVADLTAGIGVDAMALAAAGLDVSAWERDEPTAVLARHNLAPFARAQVFQGDSLTGVRGQHPRPDALFADPARRTSRGRRHAPEDYQPSLEDVRALARDWPVGIKVGPGIPHAALREEAFPDCETQWVSVDGAVVEAGLWHGDLATHPGRSALVRRGEEAHTLTGSTAQAPVGALEEYLVEPDGAVIRAGLIDELARRHDAHLLHPSIAYLSAATPVLTPFGHTFHITDVLDAQEKHLSQALRERGIGTLEIKKRGMDVDPDALRRRLRLRGSESATLILTRVGEDRVALLAQRIPTP